MRFERVEDEKLWFTVELHTCRNCQRLMIPNYSHVPTEIKQAARLKNIPSSSYSEMEICDECLKRGGFERRCDCCGKMRVFPSEFAFQLSVYPEYPSDDTRTEYICRPCVTERPTEVIDSLAGADDIEDLR